MRKENKKKRIIMKLIETILHSVYMIIEINKVKNIKNNIKRMYSNTDLKIL